jgi:hypothetical protein
MTVGQIYLIKTFVSSRECIELECIEIDEMDNVWFRVRSTGSEFNMDLYLAERWLTPRFNPTNNV